MLKKKKKKSSYGLLHRFYPISQTENIKRRIENQVFYFEIPLVFTLNFETRFFPMPLNGVTGRHINYRPLRDDDAVYVGTTVDPSRPSVRDPAYKFNVKSTGQFETEPWFSRNHFLRRPVQKLL